MRIVVAHSRPDIVSGAELAIADTVDRRADGIEYIMLPPGPGVLAEYYRSRGFTVWAREVETRRRLYPGLHTLLSWLFSRQLRRRQIDAVVCNTFAAAARMKTACRMAHVPWAVYVREYIRDKSLHRRILSEATMVLAVSRDLADYVSTMTGGKKVHVAYDHIQAGPLLERARSHGSQGTRRLPFPSECPVVGYIGRITRYKQPDLFVRSVPAVLQRIPKARFVVVGSAAAPERDFEAGLVTLARELGVEDRIAFMGQRQDAIEILSELAVCCVTSDREPFPRTILESQLLGVPVIAADTGGCPEMVEDGRTGILFASTAADASERLAASITSVLTDAGLSARLAAHEREHVLNGLAGVKPVRDFEDLLVQLRGMEG